MVFEDGGEGGHAAADDGDVIFDDATVTEGQMALFSIWTRFL